MLFADSRHGPLRERNELREVCICDPADVDHLVRALPQRWVGKSGGISAFSRIRGAVARGRPGRLGRRPWPCLCGSTKAGEEGRGMNQGHTRLSIIRLFATSGREACRRPQPCFTPSSAVRANAARRRRGEESDFAKSVISRAHHPSLSSPPHRQSPNPPREPPHSLRI